MLIKALTFDFWNTLYKIPDERKRPFRRLQEMQELFSSFGHERETDTIMQAIMDTWDYAFRTQRQEGYDIGPIGQVEQIIERLELPLNEAQSQDVYEMFTGYLRSNPPQLNDGVLEVLPVLAARYWTAVICNTGSTPGSILLEIMRSHGIADYFQEHIFSDEVYWAKPNPLIFEHTLRLLGVEAASAAHIGDDPTTDLKGARAAGMMSVWLAPRAEGNEADCDYHIREWRQLLDIF